MNKNKAFKKALVYGDAHAADFLKPAQYKIANAISPGPDAPAFDEEAIRGFEDAFGADMATGSILTRNKYLAIGFVVGAVVVGIGAKLYANYKEKRVKKIYTLERN